MTFRFLGGLSFGLLLLTVAPAAGQTRLELVQTIPLQGKPGRLDHLALDAKGQRLFVANLSNASLDVVDLRAGNLLKQIPNQRKIQGVAYAPDLDRIYVGNGDDGVCNVFDGKDYALLKSIKLPGADNVRYDPSSGRVCVGHAEKALTVLDAKTLETVATIKLPGPPEAFQLEPATNRLYVNCLSPCRVAVIDLKENKVVATFTLEGAKSNYPLALDTAGQRLFVGCRQPPRVLVVDARSGKERTHIDIPKDTDDVFHDAKRKRLYVTCGEGYLAVIEERAPDRFEVVEKITTAKLARTGLFDPGTGGFYAVLPAHEGKGPLVRVYQARP
jgi:DNA-binding beta-propeller fold protein YncE